MYIKIKRTVLAIGLLTIPLGLVSGHAFGQDDESSEPDAKVKKKKKKKKKIKDKRNGTVQEEAGISEAEEGASAGKTSIEKEGKAPATATSERQSSSSPSAWFPDWPADKFDWILQPIFGFKYTQGVNESTGTTRTTTVEGGAAGGLRGVPVIAGNPGYTLGPKVGMAYGYSSSVSKNEEGKDAKSGYHYRRQWAGLDNTFLYKSFRYDLNLTRGRLAVVEDKNRLIQSFRADNDFGLLFKTWLSGHYSLAHARAYHSKFSSPFLIENDHWIHARIFTDFLDFVFDLGPGFTEITAWDFQGENKSGKGTVNYFLLQTQFNLFWKIVGEGIGKYAIDASEKRLGLYAAARLPDDDLNEPQTLAMPEDSFLGSMFFGVKDLFFGVGVGWRYNIQVLNVSEKDDSNRETTKDHGVGLYYEIRL